MNRDDDDTDTSVTIDPRHADLPAMAAALEAGKHVTAQFDVPVTDTSILPGLDALAAAHPERFRVRLNGFRWPRDGASLDVLTHLPSVRRWSIDGFHRVQGLSFFVALEGVTDLSLGIEFIPISRILHRLDGSRMRRFSLAPQCHRTLDLAPLRDWPELDTLDLLGPFDENVDALAGHPKLRAVSFVPVRDRPMRVLNSLPALQDVAFLLNTAPRLDWFAHDGVRSLRFTNAHGLEDLGDLNRLPALQDLFIHGAPKLTGLHAAGHPHLRRLRIDNCHGFASLPPFSAFPALEEFHCNRTALDLDALEASAMPDSLRQVSLSGTERQLDAARHARLVARGRRRPEP